MEGTDSLRALAPKWSLEGDNQLLDLLQKTHQKIIERCQEVNTKLDEMASSLDEANINLQNANNKFMALSNSQFIESRVYDDDDSVLTTETQQTKEAPCPDAIDEMSMLKSTLSILERAHETAEILDDSESDSDAEISVVLKPKDMYAHRPLPYIIGSQQWKNKWHAGLIVEDSDTDSSASKRDGESDQYSESESEDITRPPLEENTLSESSGSVPGSVGAPPPAVAHVGPRPADLAAALARRLPAPHTVVLEVPEDPMPAPSQVVRKTYKPEQPATSRIFFDEPPPLDREDEPESSDEDIFAEINKHTPYTQRSTAQSNVTEDLFSFEKPAVDQGDIFSDFAPGRVESIPPVKPKSTLFEDESEPELFESPPTKETVQNQAVDSDESSVSSKKPVGGISLFGSNKGTESIGAAILKRNQRKTSTSDEDENTYNSKNQTDHVKKPTIDNKPKILPSNGTTKPINKTPDETDNKSIAKKEKDIFEDLFSKSEKVQKKPTQNIIKEAVNVTNVKSKTNEKDKKTVKDLFSDNIFDDIDDIFSSNVKIPNKESNKKSIFDDDDLFSDIDVAKTSKSVKNSDPTSKNTKTSVENNEIIIKEKKSIFDSDDELFSDIKKPTERPVRNTESHISKKTENVKDTPLSINNDNVNQVETIEKSTQNTKENKVSDSPQIVKSDPKPEIKSKSIFDSDSDDDIFAKVKTPASQKPIATENTPKFNTNIDNKTKEKEDLAKLETNKKQLTTGHLISKEKNLIQSPSLFEEDEIDDLFIAASKQNSQSNENEITNEIAQTNYFDGNGTINYESGVLSKLQDTDNVAKSVPKSVKGKESSMVHENLLEDEGSPVSSSINIPEEDPSEINTEVIESSQDITETVSAITEKPDTKTLPESQVDYASKINSKVDLIIGPETNPNETIFDDFVEIVKEKEVLTNEPKIPNANAIFDDIFSEPPDFEKPAEPKKSKNINALFDDDSDDESLFFKKNDVIFDEKPETFSNNANFGIFVNEPPAIDVDFIAKPIKNTETVENEHDLFDTVTKKETIVQTTDAIKDEENIISPVTEQVKKVSQYTENITNDNEDDLFKSVAKKENVPQSSINSRSDNNKDLSHVAEIQEKVPEYILNENKKQENISHSKAQSDIFGIEADKNILASDEKEDISRADKTNIMSQNIDSDEELFASLPNLPTPSKKYDDVKPYVGNTDDFDDIFNSKESPKKESEVKKIGKINTKNFNINVNALMPGDSPKKVPKEIQKEEKTTDESPKIIPDETDFQSNTIISHNIEKKSVENESETTKSINFDEKPESGVLDNNASKQRARIQVKRRPSSRKARHEAARRSAIDFGDETDNSSSFDEPKPKIVIKSDTQLEKRNHDLRNENENIASLSKDVSSNENKINKQETQKETMSETLNNEILQNIDSNVVEPEENVNKIDPHDSKTNISLSREATEHTNEINKQTTTKIVYILNDEDIFNTQPQNENKGKSIENTTSDNDIFKTNQSIETLGKTYREKSDEASKKYLGTNVTNDKQSEENIREKETKVNKNKSLFDDSDEELFGNKKNTNIKKTTIFDSDSEEDLFSGKKSKEKINKEQKNKEVKERKEVIVKRSLFSDDDDDDLFGVKAKKTEPRPTPSTSKEATTSSKSSEPVFSDPLSMLGNDD